MNLPANDRPVLQRSGPGTAVALPLSEALNKSCTLPSNELARLCRAMQQTVPEHHSVVQFASAYSGEGTGTVAFETAILAATLVGKRVLFIDAAEGNTGGQSNASEPPLHMLLQTRTPPSELVARAAGANLTYTVLRRYGDSGTTFTSLDEVKQLLQSLRNSYDLIIIHSPAILSDAFGIGLAELVDGSILVVEAERTRAPVALQAKQIIHENGGRVIGAVLNKRKMYIPRWLYRWL